MLSQPARDHIQALEPYLYSPDCPLPLLEDGSHPVDTLWPIGTKGHPMGAVVLPHYRTVIDTERMVRHRISWLTSFVSLEILLTMSIATVLNWRRARAGSSSYSCTAYR